MASSNRRPWRAPHVTQAPPYTGPRPPMPWLFPDPADVPYSYPTNEPNIYRLYDVNNQFFWAWKDGEHIPCWFDFIPNRNSTVCFTVEYNHYREPTYAGPLRHEVEHAITRLHERMQKDHA